MLVPLLITPRDHKRGVVMTSTERATKLRERREALGLRQFNAWVSEPQHAELRALVEYLTANPDARVVSIALQNAKTGRMQGVKLR
jgi:hypothetical protein